MLVLKKFRNTGILSPLNAASAQDAPTSLWCLIEQIALANGDTFNYLPASPNLLGAAWAKATFRERETIFAPGPTWASLGAAFTSSARKVFLHWSLPKSLARRRVLSSLLNRYDAVITNDAITAGELSTALGINGDKIIHIRYGVDTDFFKPRPAIAKSADVIVPGNAYRDEVFVDRLVRTTSLKVIRLTHSTITVQAYRQLEQEFPGRFCVRYGVKHHELPEVYQSARICVLPITKASEPAGLTCLLESLACGIPVYSNHRKTLCDYVLDGFNGGYFRNELELIAQLATLSSSREYAMSQNAREFCIRHCAWEHLRARYAEVLYPRQ